MRTLKNLTPDECVKIASIIEPNVEWKFHQSDDVWNGFDLIDKNSENENISRYIFQIDYRSNEELKSNSRFRLYVDLHEFRIDEEPILNYLKSIDCSNHP